MPEFPWRPIYVSMAQRLLEFEDRQPELIRLLAQLREEGLPVLPLPGIGGNEGEPLEEIDPFTFFASFNRRIRGEARQQVIGRIQDFLGMKQAIPGSFHGIPIVNNMQSWFFPRAASRKPDDISSLWRLAHSAVQDGLAEIDPPLFDRCLEIRTVRIGKLTIGLFWLRPDEFMPCDGNSRRLFARNGIDKPNDFVSYRRTVEAVRQRLGSDFAAVSYAAWSAAEDGDPDPDGGPPPRRAELRARRNDPDEARRVIEGFFPEDRERKAALRFLASSIRLAHEGGAGSWSVTLGNRGHKIRLNVGRLLTIDLFPETIRVAFLSNSVGPEPAAVLEHWANKAPGAFSRSVEDAADVNIPASEFSTLADPTLDALRAAHHALIEQLSQVRKTQYSRSHSPGVLAYMREELGKQLPDPDYSGAEDLWEEFVLWGTKIHEFPGALEGERPYKLEIAEKARVLRESLDEPPEVWLPLLKAVFGPPNNLTYFIDHQRLIDWANQNPVRCRAALEALWDEDRDPREQVDAFSETVPASILKGSSRPNVASVLLLALGPEDYAPYRSTVFSAGYELTGTPKPASDATGGDHYQRALEFLDRMCTEFAAREVPLQDRLDAQGLLWCLVKATRDWALVPQEDLEDLLRYVGESPSVWWLNDQRTDDCVTDADLVWIDDARLTADALASHLRIQQLRDDEVVLRANQKAIWGVSVVRRRARKGSRPGGGPSGRRVRFETLELEQPIALDEIPLGLRLTEANLFDAEGSPIAGLLYRISSDFAQHLREEFSARWPNSSPWEGNAQNRWLFQANPEYWSLSNWLRDRRVDDEGEWNVSRYRDDINPGDLVVLWESGTTAGAYAMAEITETAYERPVSERPKRPEDDAANEVAVRFRLTRKLEPPLLRAQLKDHPVLSGMDVIRAPTGTNFRVTPEQWSSLEELLGQKPIVPDDSFDGIRARVLRQGIRISTRTLRRFHHSLKTRGFVILSGVSGTGKTWLAECYGRATDARVQLVPVAPSWTSNEDLLGHWNPLDGKYHHTDFSRFLKSAAEEYERGEAAGTPPRNFLVILDEMNLARVEHYFAEFLSKMEVRSRSGRARIRLGPEEQTWLTPNLLFVGTVNVDETTHTFADKVYDRAQTVELGIERADMEKHLAGRPYSDPLLQVWDAVASVAPFAFRVADDVRRYVEEAEYDDVPWQEALDEQILQKVLPKLVGSDPRMGEALQQLADLCAEAFPLSARKIKRMYADFETHGFASYF